MRKSLVITTLIIGLSLNFCCAKNIDSAISNESDQIIEAFDVAYSPPPDGDPQMAKLDIYYVPDGKPKRLVIFIHGGSWIGGDKIHLRTTHSLVKWFVERDFVVVAPNFRLASQPGKPQVVTYREQATDIAYALAWLFKNGTPYGVTEKKALLVGYSSGAHLVALIATDSSYLKSVGLDLRNITGAISLDVHAYDVPFALQLMRGSVVSQNIPLIKFLFGDTEVEQLSGSPACYAPSVPVPPSLIISVGSLSYINGLKSMGYITYHASQHYVQLLRNLGRQTTWKHFEDENHSSLILDFGTDADGPTEAVAQFLNSLWH